MSNLGMNMRINVIRIYSVKIPFRRKIKHGLFTRHQTEAIIAVIEDDNGLKGFGEGTPRAYVTGENLDSSLDSAKAIAVKAIPCGPQTITIYNSKQMSLPKFLPW